jgi:imidazoleglycerol phosphate synthase glutamine amidotransferase subunit HisH
MARRCTRSSITNYFVITSYHSNEGKTQNVAFSHFGNKIMAVFLRADIFFRTILAWHHIIGMWGKAHQCKQRKQSDCLTFIHSYYALRNHSHILISNYIVSIFPATVRSTFLKKKRYQMIVQWHWRCNTIH